MAAHVRFTDAGDGDLSIDAEPDGLAARRQAVVALPWVWLRQVHGAEVHVVGGDLSAVRGRPGDALVTDRPGVALAVQTADCAPLALLGDEVVGVVHAGWRGLVAGVVQAAVAAAAELGGGSLRPVLGPCIGPGCYEFGADDLAVVVDRLGPAVAGRTSGGAPALDVPAAVDAALAEAGLGPATRAGGCTACAPGRLFSHRARAESGRQAVVAWLEPQR